MVPRPITFLLLLAATLGIATGLGEVMLLGIRKYVFGRYIMLHGFDVIWMSPLANGVLLLAAAVLLTPIARVAPRRGLPAAVFILTMLAVIGVLLNLANVLRLYAILLLSAGAALQFTRVILRRPTWVARWSRFAIPSMIVVTASLALAARVWPSDGGAAATGGTAAVSQGKPNVLLIVLDTVRAPSLSLYGYHRDTTPFLRSLASESVVFDRAVATAPWTLPSHASIFTGLFHHQLDVGWLRALGRDHRTLAEALRDDGYRTAAFVANTIYCSTESGLSRGFEHYDDYGISFGQILVSSSLARFVVERPWFRHAIGYYEMFGRKTATDVNEEFLTWLDDRSDERPFFAFLNYFDAHNPYLPPPPFDTRFGPRRASRDPLLVDELEHRWTREEVAAEQDAYDGAVAWLDTQLASLYRELANRGLLDNTIIVITADHGEEFNEHGVVGHSHSLYFCSLHVPLLIRYPGLPAGQRVTHAASLRDIPATMTSLAGLTSVDFPGDSLLRFFGKDPAPPGGELLADVQQPGSVPPWFPIAKGDMRSFVEQNRHVIFSGDGAVEIYDLDRDAWQTQNLITPELQQQAVRRLKESTDAQVKP